MIYVTGDLHGDLSRFRARAFLRLRKRDTLIVCGDFGFLWDGSEKEKQALRWIGRRRYQVLFIEGTHDNLDLLEEYPLTAWNGGMTREISGKLRYLCRGEIFRLEDSDLFVFGGGDSGDADMRHSWIGRELPSGEEIAAARKKLLDRGNSVDYIITHQCSRKLKKFLTMADNDANVLDAFFDEVRTECKFKRWFFGSYHINKVIPPNEMALYTAVTPINSPKLLQKA